MEKHTNETPNCLIAPLRISRIKQQGYDRFSAEEISAHSIGNRFAYQLCTLLFTIGLILTNIPVLAAAVIIAFLGAFLPYHPFDYLYNSTLRHWLQRPRLPPRSAQAKFACSIAAIWLGIIIYLFYTTHFIAGYMLGSVLFVIALMVSTIDFCIPSLIYNFLFRKK